MGLRQSQRPLHWRMYMRYGRCIVSLSVDVRSQNINNNILTRTRKLAVVNKKLLGGANPNNFIKLSYGLVNGMLLYILSHSMIVYSNNSKVRFKASNNSKLRFKAATFFYCTIKQNRGISLKRHTFTILTRFSLASDTHPMSMILLS